MPVLIDNGHVTCPHCSEDIEVKQQRVGATYTKTWKNVPARCLNIVQWWIHSYPYDEMTKQEALTNYRFNNNITTGSFFARISELLGLEILNVTREVRVNDSYIKKKTLVSPRYSLNISKAQRVLAVKGDLKKL